MASSIFLSRTFSAAVSLKSRRLMQCRATCTDQSEKKFLTSNNKPLSTKRRAQHASHDPFGLRRCIAGGSNSNGGKRVFRCGKLQHNAGGSPLCDCNFDVGALSPFCNYGSGFRRWCEFCWRFDRGECVCRWCLADRKHVEK